LGKKYIDNPTTIGEKLRNRRLELGLLQRDVAKIIGVDECSIYLWEQGKGNPRVYYYPKIIGFLTYFPFQIDLSGLSGRIIYYRYINGLSPKEFGLLINVDASTIRAWEKQINPSTK
jgi:transcriptional regulator with XRE-family HTH domain